MTDGLSHRAAALRLAFDRAFAEPVQAHSVERQDFLMIRIGAEPWALRLADISGLFADRPVTPVPSSADSLIGIAGFRGTMLPVYNLATLLHRPGSSSLRWLVTAAQAPIGLAFEIFDRYLRVSPDAVLTQQGKEQAPGNENESLHLDDALLPIVPLRSLLDNIAKATIGTISQGER